MSEPLQQELKIGIAGLGLIGGSLAMAFSEAGYAVRGYDISRETVGAALEAGCVGQADTRPDVLFDVDYLFIALYPADIIRFMNSWAASLKEGSVVVDCCGVKERIVQSLVPVAREHRLRYIGGHPMAGTEKCGFSAARADLFAGASFILTPEDGADTGALQALLLSAGFGRVVLTTPAEHDRMIAFTSQLPHVLACAYVKSPCCPGHKGFSAGSYRDVSRVAHLSAEMWSGLFIDNQKALCAEIDTLIGHLAELRGAVFAGDQDALRELLAQSCAIKDGADNAD